MIIACTGLGSVNPSIDDYVAASDGTIRHTVLTPTVLIGGVPAQLIYSVLSPQFVSEYQIAVTLAANTPTGNTVPIQIQIGSVTTSDQVTVAVARKSSDERGVFARECPHPPQARVNDQRIPEGNSIQPLNGGFLVGRFITAREVLP